VLFGLRCRGFVLYWSMWYLAFVDDIILFAETRWMLTYGKTIRHLT